MKLFTVILAGSLALLAACGEKKKDVTPESTEGPGLHDPPAVQPPEKRCDEARMAQLLAEVAATVPEPGGGAVPEPKRCRTIATRWTVGTTQHACAWDGTALTCASNWHNCPTMRHEYASVRDLVWEGETIGRVRAKSALSQATPMSGACDPAMRITEPVARSPGLSAIYGFHHDGDALTARFYMAGVSHHVYDVETTVRRDAALRVTLATLRSTVDFRPERRKSESCAVISYEYLPDRVTKRTFVPDKPVHEEVSHYDERGIEVGSGAVRYEITATQEICLE